MKCAVTITTIENGHIAEDCMNTYIMHGSSCHVECDDGYVLSNALECDGIRLRYAQCYDPETEICMNTCGDAFDGKCDDGGEGKGDCAYGTVRTYDFALAHYKFNISPLS